VQLCGQVCLTGRNVAAAATPRDGGDEKHATRTIAKLTSIIVGAPNHPSVRLEPSQQPTTGSS
jgi:hypothetical protein